MDSEPFNRWVRQLKLAIQSPDADEQLCDFFGNIETDVYNRALNDVAEKVVSDACSDIIHLDDLKYELLAMRLGYHFPTPSIEQLSGSNIVLFKRII